MSIVCSDRGFNLFLFVLPEVYLFQLGEERPKEGLQLPSTLVFAPVAMQSSVLPSNR